MLSVLVIIRWRYFEKFIMLFLFNVLENCRSNEHGDVHINKISEGYSLVLRGYWSNEKCTWLMTAPSKQLVRIYIQSLDIVQPGDYLVARDGSDESAVLLRNFTTGDVNRWWTSSGRFLWLKYTSDRQNNKTSWIFFLRMMHSTNVEGNFIYMFELWQIVRADSRKTRTSKYTLTMPKTENFFNPQKNLLY